MLKDQHGSLKDFPGESLPLILDVKGNSLDDGPGIRSVVFFKGCPLSCVWCHNPESKKAVVEIAFDAAVCTGCDTCLDVCEQGALLRDKPGYIDRRACNLCFACVAVCPSGALEQVGRAMSVDAITDTILKDKPFFDTSGGGVTFSGGEPTLFMPFLSRLASSIRQAGVHTLLETCGFFEGERFVSLVLPHLDTIYFDLKLFDREAHRRYCGVPNDTILENVICLAEWARHGAIDFLPRIPLIPGITATPDNLRAWAAFLKTHRLNQVKLLAYNPLWPEKTMKIGENNAFLGEKFLQSWMPPAAIKESETIFHRSGIQTL
jgi:pyruvate formate lyase activating enzyme